MIVHFIVNSHLDPVWLWRREQGIDEVLSTARTACELLEDYQELHITRGEAWFYEIIENYAPALFERIRAHVAAGRWHIVGGWYIQPDCNLASAETYRKHGEIACDYFRKKFGVTIQTGYNVDSFGHNAMLPSFYQDAGIRNYIFMRPMPEEMTLPANDFIWRAPDGAEVLTSRIIDHYATFVKYGKCNLECVLAKADPALGHVMCFWGVGDHGGGPFREEIEWVKQHKNDYPGVEFRFSHPDAYFEAVRASGIDLPVHEGELQHHAIGCYAAFSRIKREVRKTENMLLGPGRYATPAKQTAAWKKLLFATFHDLHAGTSVKAGYDDIFDSLGAARETAYEAFLKWSRQKNLKLPPSTRQRVIFDNTSAGPFRGFVTFQPSLIERWRYNDPVAFYSQDGTPYPAQKIPSERSSNFWFSFIFPMDIPAGGRKILELDYTDTPSDTGSVRNKGTALLKNDLISAAFDRSGITALTRNGTDFLAAPPEAVVYPDETDTWSHGINAYTEKAHGRFRQKGKWQNTVTGPVFSELSAGSADADGNTLIWHCGIFDGIPGIQLRLRLNWHDPQRLVKLHIKPAFEVIRRIDGIPGGTLERQLNGEEYPVFNTITLAGREHTLTMISADIFSADVQPDGTARLTLLRTPYFAHHTPCTPQPFAKNGTTDLGEHEFTLILLADAEPSEIADAVHARTEPVYCSESTDGMSRIYTDPLIPTR